MREYSSHVHAPNLKSCAWCGEGEGQSAVEGRRERERRPMEEQRAALCRASERDNTGRLSLILTLLSCTEKRDTSTRVHTSRGLSIENAFYRPEAARDAFSPARATRKVMSYREFAPEGTTKNLFEKSLEYFWFFPSLFSKKVAPCYH